MTGYMSKTSGDSDQSASDGPKSSPRSDITSLFIIAADTTWRMFIPMIGFTLLGVWVDQRVGSKPWLMVLGIAIGTMGAILLVRNQIRAINSKSQKESKKS